MTHKVEILYFTDPFCSWCWACEPALYALRERYRDQLSVRYVMGGLVKAMSAFFDAANAIRSTAEVAPHWRMVSERSGQPIDERIMLDITDPNWSTWPAGIAVKAAELQGAEVGERYLRRLRRAALAERIQVQLSEAQIELAAEVPGLDLTALQAAILDGRAEQSFHQDLALCRAYGVTGFPTMLFRPAGAAAPEAGILAGGYRSTSTYEQILRRLEPDLIAYPAREIEELVADYGPLTTRELAEISGVTSTALVGELEGRATAGRLEAWAVRGGHLWMSPRQARGSIQ